MLEIIHIVLDVLFPPRETEKTVRKISSSDTEALYRPGSHANHQHLASYQQPAVQALIAENKFHHSKRAATLLAQLLGRWLLSHQKHVIFVPIPLGKERYKDRGYNQVTEVLRQLPNQVLYSVLPALERAHDTVPQTTLERRDRLHNMQGAFTLKKAPLQIHDRAVTVVIVDDVTTTGATLTAARAALAPHLPQNTELITLALAH